ncbi:leucyl aminopeptidase [Halobacillus dabanensis]|uniref:Probable cytosol aminopeptidase n=1 Tax=Halobacillus dabanensis TaxID=240302 RepID=A0A1I3R4Q7_HALDA|nr:leucyl aminopeptidase [Halobacillus dabanensis]SFJ40226.1 leucyl aminopeptidase [Halobacillus dabanensis]
MFTINNKWTESDALLFGLFEDQNVNENHLMKVKDEIGVDLNPYIQTGHLSSTRRQLEKVLLPENDKLQRIYVVGMGSSHDMSEEHYRKTMGLAFQRLKKDEVESPAIFLDSFIPVGWSAERCSALISEVMLTSTFRLPSFKTHQKDERDTDSLVVWTNQEQHIIQAAFEKGRAFADGVNTARYLVHLPANILTASEMAEFATTMAEDYDFEINILDKEDMEELGMGALLAVNQGSTEPPKMIVLKYQGLEKWDDITALVGKGITYDTGGYSIKSKTGMPGMKGDMGGAAAVLGAMETIGRMKPKKNVLAVIPSSDNMISGDAFKPDDVITSMSGKTIEVLNTDAEGRLALADGVTYAQERGASRVINVATLTGGVVTALGSWMTGAMTNEENFYKDIEQAGKEAGEPMWLLPYNEDYKAQVKKSDIADLNNSPTRKAHAIMGGAFVGAFVEKVPWVHLDIAGTSMSENAHELGPKGPTGVMAKTLAGYIIK